LAEIYSDDVRDVAIIGEGVIIIAGRIPACRDPVK